MNQHIVHQTLDLQALIDQTDDPSCGALVTFSGNVRNQHEGASVAAITYSAYEELAQSVLAEIEKEAIERFGVAVCSIRHRVGRVEVGESSVVIVVRAPHRNEAWDAARYAINQLKKRAPIYKVEHLTNGTDRHADGVPLAPPTNTEST